MSSSSNVAVNDLGQPSPSGAADSSQASGSSENLFSAPPIGYLHGGDNAPQAGADDVPETSEPSARKSQRDPKAPGKYGENLLTADLFKRFNSSSLASMAGEPSRKRAKPAGSIRAQPQMVAAQPSTSGSSARKRARQVVQDVPQVDAPSQPSTSVSIQTDALSIPPPSKQDAATMPETSENVDVGIQTVPLVDAVSQPSTSMGVQTDTPPTTQDAATMPENLENVDVGIQTTSSSQEEAAQTDSASFLGFSEASSVSCSPPSVSNGETQTGSACSLEFTGVSSVSFLPVALLDSATQAEDPVRSLELCEVISESVSQEIAAPQDEPEEQPSTSSSARATDALTALNQRTWTPTTPPLSSSVEPVARRLRSRAVVQTSVASRTPSHDEGSIAGRLRSKTVASTDVVSRSPSPIAHRLRQRGPANPEEKAAELPPPKTREELQERLKNLDQGSEGFMMEWARGEHLLDNKNAENVFISETGEEFMAKVETSHGVHLVKNKEGLKMKVPEDLDFGTVRDYIKTDKELSVINSNTQDPELMTMCKLLKEFKKSERTAIYNLLSLEFAQTEDRLKKAFEEPEFVKSYSMVMKLEKALGDLKKKLGRKLRTATSQDEKEKIEEKIKKINNQLKTMPKFQKFLLLSMSGSFTDIHVDFSDSKPQHLVEMAKIFLEELGLKLEGDLKKEEEEKKKKAPKTKDNTDADNVKWYTCAEKKKILEELERRCQ
ncbi:hypothetical protein CAEBREN_03657 [Caenorhabditis brenneri]|uniref:Uncharacterized protein n=1 Tax=Caenorhabditis brenneri TaxID=135651 RepID=G0NSB3_CAEBE|nr:hypothetical protein CAEBREN_03657 [Caenorhabditis brenneri]